MDRQALSSSYAFAADDDVRQISDGTSFDYYTATMAGFVNRPIYILNPDTSSFNTGDACTELPASTPDLSPYIVVIKRGTCTFAVKCEFPSSLCS